jgi:hypothetical protein
MDWVDETFAPRVDIALRAGYATETTCEVVIASLSNTVANLNVNGVDYPIVWTELGADIAAVGQVAWDAYPELGPFPSKAGYVANVQVTGLSALTRYDWTLTQVAGDPNTGSFMTKPTDNGTDPFSLWFISCDAGQGAAAATAWSNGGYQTIAEYMKADVFPLVGIVHIDDYGYLSAQGYASLNDYKYGDPDRTGLAQWDAYSAVAVGAGGEYCGAVAWFAYLNLTGYKTAIPDSWDAPTSGDDSAIRSFSGDHRIYVGNNANFLYTPGDWEYGNDIGWDQDTQVASLQKYQTGRHVQDIFVTPIMPPAIPQNNGTDRGVNPINYSTNYGPVQILALDGVVNGTGAMDVGTVEDYTDPVTTFDASEMLHGPKQLNDALVAFNNTLPFKILMLMYGIRYPITPFGAESGMGVQHPISDHFPLEYAPFFSESGNAVKSIMDNPNTNGTVGKITCIHGDTHNGSHQTHRRIKSGLIDELFDSLYVGTINTSGIHGNVNVPVGSFHDGTTMRAKFTVNSEWSSVRLDVRVDLDPIELHYYFYNEASITQPAAVFKQTADSSDSALVRIDDMSKTFREAYTPDIGRALTGYEILGATKQDAGDDDTGFLTHDLSMFMDLQYIRASEQVPSISHSFSRKGIISAKEWLADQGGDSLLLSGGNFMIKPDGSIGGDVPVALSVSPPLLSVGATRNLMWIAVIDLPGAVGAFSIGGNYYYYAKGFYLSTSDLCGITQVPLEGALGTDAFVRFPSSVSPDNADQTVIMGLYYDPLDQNKCRKFEVAVRGGVTEFNVTNPTLFGTVPMAGGFTCSDSFIPPKESSTPGFGIYRMQTDDDLTLQANIDIIEAGFRWMKDNPHRGIAPHFSVISPV